MAPLLCNQKGNIKFNGGVIFAISFSRKFLYAHYTGVYYRYYPFLMPFLYISRRDFYQFLKLLYP